MQILLGIICHTLIEEMVVLGNALCFLFEKEEFDEAGGQLSKI